MTVKILPTEKYPKALSDYFLDWYHAWLAMKSDYRL